jgi:glycosyltransferase involved in cell wall biosynthesis
LKILHIITRLDRGGSADNTLLCCIGQRRGGHDVTLVSGIGVTKDSPLKKTAGEEGVKLIHVPSLVRAVIPVHDLRALWACYRIIRFGRYDVVHTHTSKAGILGRLAARLNRAERVIHTPHGHVFYGYFGRLKSSLFIWMEKLMARSTDIIVTLTDREAEEHLEHGVGKPGQFVTVFSGIPMKNTRAKLTDGQKSAVKVKLGLPPEGPLIVSVGRLDPIKGHDTLIRSFALVEKHHPEARLVLAGDGELTCVYEDLARKLGIHEKISFLGWRNDVGDILEVSDLFVLPSINEGMGRAVIEAMSAGLAVVATNVGGVPTIVEGGETGLLVEPQDPALLSDAIGHLLSHPKKRIGMGQNGHTRASEFSDEKMVQHLEAVYQERHSSTVYVEVSV